LRSYVVWVPKKGATEANVAEATHTVSDPRASHFWDGAGLLLRTFDPVLGLGGDDAWDVYLLFRPEAEWHTMTPPKPDFWMNQLTQPSNPDFLDPHTFRSHVESALQ
jgi:hypothetical protein